MMTKSRIYFFLAVLLFLGAGGLSLWYITRDSEEAKVKATLNTLCRIASKPEGEGNSAGILKANSTPKVFASECRIDFRHEMFAGTYTPADLSALLMRSRMLFTHCRVGIRDLVITIESTERASAVFSGTFTGQMADGKTVNEARDLYCVLKKVEGEWLLENISVHDVLER